MESGLYDFSSISMAYSHTGESPGIDILQAKLDERMSVNAAPNAIVAKFKKKAEYVAGSTRTNVHMAIFVTARARLQLYEILKVCQHHAYYCDTDSVFVSASAAKGLKKYMENPFWIGQLKSETDNDAITRFMAIGKQKIGFCQGNIGLIRTMVHRGKGIHVPDCERASYEALKRGETDYRLLQ